MEKTRCPQCDLEIDHGAKTCPFCFAELGGVKPAAPRAAGPAGAGGFPWVYFVAAGALIALAVLVPRTFLKRPGKAPASSPAPAPVQAPAPGPREQVRKSAAANGLKVLSPQDPGRKWSLSGSVFDAATLAPKAGFQLIFQDRNSQQAYGTKTDAKGRYRLLLPENMGGFDVSVPPESGGRVIEDSLPSLARLSRDRRDTLIQAESGPEASDKPNVMGAGGKNASRNYAFIPFSAAPAEPPSEE